MKRLNFVKLKNPMYIMSYEKLKVKNNAAWFLTFFNVITFECNMLSVN